MHESVLRQEVVAHLVRQPGGLFIDGTLGDGGHAAALLDRGGPDARLLGIDRDPAALARARRVLERFGRRCTLVHGNFADVERIAAENGAGEIDGMVLDLGVSSEQLDTAERGFSFLAEAPLDMRMDPGTARTAADLVRELPERELSDLLFRLGEEPAARRIARAIVRERECRPIATTTELAELVSRAKGGRRGRTHPATQTFQALRMAVNGELEAVERGVEAGIRLVRPGGRVAVISFHSLEDRIVKTAFRRHEGQWVSLPAGGREWQGALPRGVRVTRKPVAPGDAETRANPRARSAKLRVFEREA